MKFPVSDIQTDIQTDTHTHTLQPPFIPVTPDEQTSAFPCETFCVHPQMLKGRVGAALMEANMSFIYFDD